VAPEEKPAKEEGVKAEVGSAACEKDVFGLSFSCFPFPLPDFPFTGLRVEVL
tara:strand:- start:392 stop:547 length:156 start_codon:yes stop_codon:yes gene_type:complete